MSDLDDLDQAVAAFAAAKIATTGLLTLDVAKHNAGTSLTSADLNALVSNFDLMTTASNSVRAIMKKIKATPAPASAPIPVPAPAPIPAPTNLPSTWKDLRIGAGGFTNNFDFHRDGTKVVRTDTMGAVIKRPGDITWSQLVDATTMPIGDPSLALGSGNGVYEIRIAPSNSSRLYMSYGVWNASTQKLEGYLYRSDNAGLKWIRLANFPQHYSSGNDQATEGTGAYLAIDPQNPDIVLVGTANDGAFKSADGGVTWTPLGALGLATRFPGSGQGGGTIFVFDATSAIIGNAMQGIYASTYGVGVFRSTDGGANWGKLSGAGTSNPALITHNHMACAGGALLLVDNAGTANAPSGSLNKWNGAWSIDTGPYDHDQLRCIAVDPASSNNWVAAAAFPDGLSYSNDAGKSWHTQMFASTRIAADVPWLATTREFPQGGAVGNYAFDPAQSNVLYYGSGVGVWKASPSVAPTLQWTSENAGIEQLVTMHLLKPPSGSLIAMCMDRPVFTIANPDAYATQHGLSYNQVIDHGIHADYAKADPKTIFVNTFNHSGYSLNGGGIDGAPSNWTEFVNFPGGTGTLASARSTDCVFVQNSGKLYVTHDRGATAWFQPAGAPDHGYGGGWMARRNAAAADHVLPDTYYIYNSGSGDDAVAGVYKSSDRGSTFARVFSGHVYGGDGIHMKMKTVPNNAGHLFWTAGQLDDDTLKIPVGSPASASRFFICKDGGVSWTAVANVLDVWAFGFGKAAAGTTYPAVYFYGFYNGVGGVWRIDNADQASPTFTQLSDLNPKGHLDKVNALEADMDTFGRVYIGFIGSGCVYL